MTDASIGFATALEIATDAIDRLHSTAHSHHRIIVAELMGHGAGWLTLGAGLAGGADVILIPEIPYSVGDIATAIKRRVKAGTNFSIVAVAEGARSIEDAKALAAAAMRIEKAGDRTAKDAARAEYDLLELQHAGTRSGSPTSSSSSPASSRGCRSSGYVQRGGTPSPRGPAARDAGRLGGRGPREGRDVRGDGRGARRHDRGRAAVRGRRQAQRRPGRPPVDRGGAPRRDLPRRLSGLRGPVAEQHDARLPKVRVSMSSRSARCSSGGKNRVPAPRTTGWTYSRYSSTRPAAMSDPASVGPPTSMSKSARALSRATSATASSRTRRAPCATDSRVRENTTFGIACQIFANSSVAGVASGSRVRRRPVAGHQLVHPASVEGRPHASAPPR